MVHQIDHIVIGVRNLVVASADYERLGFTVTPGGEHTGGATHNTLISFDDGSYFELIAFTEPDRPQPHRWWSRVENGEGLVDFALLSGDLHRESARVQAAGIVSEPRDGGRIRPDGQHVSWKSASLQFEPTVQLPFVIEDVTARDLRVPNGEATVHALGVTGIAGISVLVANVVDSLPAFAALLESEGEEHSTAIKDVAASRLFSLGPHWLEVIQPKTGSGLAQHLVERGEGPFEVALTGLAQAELPLETSHGARLRAG